MSCPIHDAEVGEDGAELRCRSCGATGVRSVRGAAVQYDWYLPGDLDGVPAWLQPEGVSDRGRRRVQMP